MRSARDGQAAGQEFGRATRDVMPDQGVTHVQLFRHGQVEGFSERKVRGQLDVPLSDHGLAEHRRLVDWTTRRAWKADRILTSGLRRCRELAEQLGERMNVPVEQVPALREQHMGEWQGRTWDEISATHGRVINDYWDDYWATEPPGGESMAAMSERVLAWWKDLPREFDGERIFVVTHAGVIRALLCDWLGVDARSALRFAPPVASCTSVLHSAAGAVIEGLGERPLAAASEQAPASLDKAIGDLDSEARQQTMVRPESSSTLSTDSPVGATQAAAPLRIALSGSAGTGKTTLGRALALKLDLPFIEERMRLRLEGGLDLHTLNETTLRELCLELWHEQKQLELEYESGFVADRSSIDYAAFWLHYGFYIEPEQTELALQEMFSWADSYSSVLLFPHGVIPLVHDGVRATNPWQQRRYQLLVEGLLSQYLETSRLLRVPAVTDFDQRLAWALDVQAHQSNRP
ncbi:MAG: alpha-ribazole phosphatase [Planctomycetota bacterium]|jgi:alpha-ribazole phosphatase